MLCSVSVSAHNIVTLLLAWRDCQNGTLDSINSMYPSLPTHIQTHLHAHMHDCQNGTLDSINSVHPPLPTHVQTHITRRLTCKIKEIHYNPIYQFM